MVCLKTRIAKLGISIAISSTLGASAPAQNLTDLKTGSGSEMVYGPLDGCSDLQSGLVFVLKKIHGHYGSKPELGGFFKAKSANCVGTFFNVDDKNFSHQKQSGLVLLQKGSDGQIQTAVLTDRVEQFNRSVNGMLKKVQAVWHGGGTGPLSEPVQPLQTYRFPDNSGTVMLAQGWRPIVARAGGALAVGPNSETMALSCYLGVLDANNPQVRQRLSSGLPGNFAASPSNASPAVTFGYLYNQLRLKHGLGQGRIIATVVKTSQGPLGTNFFLTGEFSGPNGVQSLVAEMSAGPVNPRLGGWACIMTTVTAPKQLFGRESSTLFAMANSLQANDAVIHREGEVASERLRDYGRKVRENTERKTSEFGEYMKSIDSLHDSEDRNSAAFADLQLDQSVVGNVPSGLHGRLYNDDANALVESDPEKWQIVPGSQYIKGRDY